MKTIRTEDAVGHVLYHDLTQIIKGVSKGPKFKKGHIIQTEDIETLLSMGKEQLYVYEYNENTYHENEAAEHLAEICRGENIRQSGVSEGKINLTAACDGLLKVNVELLNRINDVDKVMIATKYSNSPVKKGEAIGGTRIIPLVIDKSVIEKCEKIAGKEKLLSVMPYKKMKVGIVTTGNEVYYGRIEDTFTDVVREKMSHFNFEEIGHRYSTDDMSSIAKHIVDLIGEGADFIMCTGGMSVDPDDNTPGAIREVASKVVSYGAPVLPGAMFMLAYKGNIPIVGLPGCVMYCGKTVFDILLPRLAAGEEIEKWDIVSLGNGGFL
ncbi:molybdopterin-binding protein [Anaerosphaera multitolerans]|uniref:Molybdopterin molybdenumtransferase n=1 Tax=Anaerosphaera multitolerans TaxID=2487351 RepID=A0A437S550_9FIRM|nr:molybdopterin-binding protein [Anaerosphaera multitolerans]RVU54124.1 molybdenum cofactor biosynthesis protein MoaB [Anaerosphaera multitolerans]